MVNTGGASETLRGGGFWPSSNGEPLKGSGQRSDLTWQTVEYHSGDWNWHTHTAAAKSLQSCPTLCDPIDRSPPGYRPRDSPAKNTGVGCHFPLQCMKEKSESEVTQSCPTLSDPMDCSLPGSSVHGIFQARGLEWGAISFSYTHYYI